LGRTRKGNSWGNGLALFSPSSISKESDTTLDISLKLPGLDEKDVEAKFDKGVLNITVQKRKSKSEAKKISIRSES
jgi:HSP20 family molecular chaperone IbpA